MPFFDLGINPWPDVASTSAAEWRVARCSIQIGWKNATTNAPPVGSFFFAFQHVQNVQHKLDDAVVFHWRQRNHFDGSNNNPSDG